MYETKDEAFFVGMYFYTYKDSDGERNLYWFHPYPVLTIDSCIL